ncbi:hypothetical protein F4553_005007 [Allocatelliglobosispora scoriae]|uniref:Uncharacterized protein n=1 Tax=Allocatelliglobosispora scoriae TaxID=643052 RepID=A0A841BVY7_9ACTN|nr:hypothetical protein [Allocatelliglobosispora scoriae]MBB5871628.1 hypothetical protein [Allocatelliglobosispora scoriae]
MAISEEDLGPRWLRDYGDVNVDVATLLKFGNSLIAELDLDYKPHAMKIFDDMSVPDGYSSAEFFELVDALATHRTVRVETTTSLARHADGIFAFGSAAKEISNNYGEADAYSGAKVGYVERLMADAPAARDDGSTQPSSTAIPILPTTQVPATTGSTDNSGTTALGPDGKPLY